MKPIFDSILKSNSTSSEFKSRPYKQQSSQMKMKITCLVSKRAKKNKEMNNLLEVLCDININTLSHNNTNIMVRLNCDPLLNNLANTLILNASLELLLSGKIRDTDIAINQLFFSRTNRNNGANISLYKKLLKITVKYIFYKKLTSGTKLLECLQGHPFRIHVLFSFLNSLQS